MSSLRKRLVVPTVLAVSFGACLQPKQNPKPDAGETTIDDAGTGDGSNDTDAGPIDAEPMPDSPPDAPPDAPVG